MQFRFLSEDDVATVAHLRGVAPARSLKTWPLVRTEVPLSGMFQKIKGSRCYQREREERQRPHQTMALSSKVFSLDVQGSGGPGRVISTGPVHRFSHFFCRLELLLKKTSLFRLRGIIYYFIQYTYIHTYICIYSTYVYIQYVYMYIYVCI